MERSESALNYNKYGLPVGKHQNQCRTIKKRHSSRDKEFLAGILKPIDELNPTDEVTFSHHYPTYMAWRVVVEANGPYSHFFTLAFRRPYPDRQAVAALSDWATMMNRSIKGPRWKRKKQGFAGVAFAERHSLSRDFRGRLHFHVLMKRSGDFPSSDVLSKTAYANALRLKDVRGRAMTDPWRIDLREVKNADRLIRYLLKDIYSGDWQDGDNIAFWRPSAGMDEFQLSPLSARQLVSRH